MQNTVFNHNLEGAELEKNIGTAFKHFLESVPFIDNVKIDYQQHEHGVELDLIAKVKIAGTDWSILVEANSIGQPRMARSAIATWEMWRLRKPSKKEYFVFASPLIGEKAQVICREAGVGFFDLAGNCRVCFDHVFIERTGQTKEPEKRLLRSLFYPKAARVIRRLLNDPAHAWHVHELASSAQVSTGLVSQVKTKLLDSELAQRRGDMFVITAPDELLNQWAATYRFGNNSQQEFYSYKPLQEVEQMIVEHCNQAGIEYAFTLFSGARLIGSQYVRGIDRSIAYVMSDLKSVGDQLGLKQVESGGNIILAQPADFDLLFAKQSVNGCWVVSDIQLFLDFSSLKGRAKETAEFILDSRIRKNWAEK